MKELILVNTLEVTKENGETFWLRYYRTETSLLNSTYYGVSVEKHHSKPSEDEDTFLEKELEAGLTYSLETITGVLELLSKNQVTPCTLINILDELDISVYPDYIAPLDESRVELELGEVAADLETDLLPV